MELAIHFIRVNGTKREHNKMCDMYGDRLLDLFGTVSAAYAASQDWHRTHEPPIHHWTTYNRIAFLSSTHGLSPSERQGSRFIVEFI